ncbi:MAG: SusC/RagA family TonB-linked outer membrane protein [Moheibacter sp.]
MSTKLRGLLVVFGILFGGILIAQEKTVTGTVTDANGFTLPDVSVRSSSGEEVFTDMDGNFSIQASEGEVLTIESFGMDIATVVVGASNTYNATLRDGGAIELEGAVVTALGITREKKSLGYATQEVSGETLSAVPVQNFADALSGEVAGLDVKSSGTMGGSTNMVVRGFNSLLGSNQSLVVVDGTPINNNTYNTADQTTGRGGFDYGNAASDINPNDIESINVLKGAAATALYGSRGQNGVIMITTKKGKRSKGIGVEINSSITIGSVDKETLPKYQKKYGQGYSNDGSHPLNPYFDENQINGGLGAQLGADASYGAEFDPTLMVYQWNSIYPLLSTYNQATPWVAAKNDPNSVWRTSATYVNSASFSGSNENGSFRFGYTNYLHDGSLENSNLTRNTLDFSGEYEFTDRLTVSTNIIFTNNRGKGRVGTGYDGWNPMQAFRQWWAVNVDLNEQRDAYLATRQNMTWNANWRASEGRYVPAYTDNYYWTRYENYQTDERNRYTGNATVNYELTNWLSVMGRFAFDNFDEIREDRMAIGSAGDYANGRYRLMKQTVSENNYDLMLNANRSLTDNITLDALVGWNLRVNRVDRFDGETNGGLLIPRIYSLANTKDPLTSDQLDQIQGTKMVDGIYGRASVGFYNFLFLEGSIRTDRSSALPIENNRYWYPSGSVSFVFSDLIDGSWLSFGKLRGGYAEVGNDTDMYNLYNTYTLVPGISGGSATNPARFNNSNLEEERMKEFEIGLEMAFFKNRISFDVSYYDQKTEGLITPVDISASSGARSVFLNAGDMTNKGIEARLSLTPIRTEDFSWQITANFAKNTNEVTKLYEDIEYLQLASLQGGISIGAQVGEAYGVIRGVNYEFDANGNKIVGEDGYYLTTDNTSVLGNMNPEWTGGIRNMVTYKNLSLSFLIDISKGGDVFSLDTFYGYSTGLYDNFTTGLNDLGNPVRNPLEEGGGIILPGVKEDGTPNDIRIIASDGYNNPWGYTLGSTAPRAAHVYDASFVKLRNVTLGYDLPSSWTGNSFIDKFTVSLIGRNLWIIDKNVPFSDPEAGLSAGNIQGYQSGAHPTMREIGASIKIQF